MKIENKFVGTFNDLKMEYCVSRAEIATIFDVNEATVGFWKREGNHHLIN